MSTENSNSQKYILIVGIIATLGALIGAVIAGYFGIQAAREPILIEIETTQTAKARATLDASTVEVIQAKVQTPTDTIIPTTKPTDFIKNRFLPFENIVKYEGEKCSIDTELAPDYKNNRVDAIEIRFDIMPGGYCSIVVPLDGYNASKDKTISFWVKGEGGGEKFEIGVKDTNVHPGQEQKIPFVAAVKWQIISIDLDEFKGQDISSLENFSLGFSYELDSNGTIYIDELFFGQP